MPAIDRLKVWNDTVPRSGPENMAVDEWLHEQLADVPVLRVYRWEGPWASLGYFQELAEAQRLFAGENLGLVRRATGGGIVDHRIDWTYSLMAPRGERLARERGAESYRLIHHALARALREAGVEGRLLESDAEGDSAACFEKPVAWDVVGTDGRKIAGAGQRRTRHGLLHQGSVLTGGDVPMLASHLSEALASRPGEIAVVPDAAWLERCIEQRFGSRDWTEKR